MVFAAVPESLKDMISAADSLMYIAKATGKNRVHLEMAGTDVGSPAGSGHVKRRDITA
jgi:hypothetical protein